MLNDTRYMRDAHFAERIRAMTSVVQDKALFRVDRIHEVRAEADGESDDTHKVAWRWDLDVLRFHRHGAQKAKVVRGRHEDVAVTPHTRPFDGRLRMIERQASPKDLLLGWHWTQLSFKLTDEG